MEETLVLYPNPQISHVVAMVELAKLILKRHASISIIIYNMTVPFDTSSATKYINDVVATNPSITLHELLEVPLPLDDEKSATVSIEHISFEMPSLQNPNLRQALESLSKKTHVKAIIIDFFNYAALEISSSLKIPTYFLYTSGASILASDLYLPTIDKNLDIDNFFEFNDFLHFPGIPPIHTSCFPEVCASKSSPVYQSFIDMVSNLTKANGIILNTFEALESRPLKAISEGLCTPELETPPSLYCVGPILSLIENNCDYDKENAYLNWLDLQPSRSVVFLCFGSQGKFKADQIKEMSIALERSSQRFLWVVRHLEDEVDFPRGFLEKTKERGLVWNSWAPQVAVLNHDAVGGFVTHCGWNSVLEAISAGVPMIAWPLFAEQMFNKVFMVEEMKVALPLEESDGWFVKAIELEKCRNELMEVESESGKAVRESVVVMRHAAKAALAENGSSYLDLEKFIDSWKLGSGFSN